jgi:hypothetical protein
VPRTSRENVGIIAIPIASVAFSRLGPSTATTTIAMRNPGNASIASTARISEPSTQPP